jgi:hypothetical protein
MAAVFAQLNASLAATVEIAACFIEPTASAFAKSAVSRAAVQFTDLAHGQGRAASKNQIGKITPSSSGARELLSSPPCVLWRSWRR